MYGVRSLSLYEDDPANLSGLKENLSELTRSNEVHFIKTHELPDDGNPAVLLVRDGRDAMVSFAHFIEDYGVVRRSRIGEFVAQLDAYRQHMLWGRPRFDQLLRRVITGKYFDWSSHFLAWQAKPGRCALVNFESLTTRPAETVQRSLAALGIALQPRSNEAIPDFRQLHATDPKFFRAGTTGQWRTEMNTELEDLFWREHGKAMMEAGYAR